MRAAQKKKFLKELLKQRKELVAVFKRNQSRQREALDEGTLDLADKAADGYTREFNFTLTDNDRERIARLDAALERLEGGDYGKCDECGEKISDARLKAIPWAILCVDCQQEREAAADRNKNRE